MTQAELQELEELAAAIEESEGIPPRAARRKAESILADLKRQAHRWDDQAMRAGNPIAVDVKRN
jgi:hypothetical protein